MKKNTYVLFACIGFLIVWGLYYFMRAEGPAPVPSLQPKEEQNATMLYTGNSIIQEKNGKRMWELQAEKIEVDVETQNVRLKTVKGVFYQDNGGKLEITAPEGAMDSRTKDVLLTGKVNALASDGATFSAKEVKWTDQQGKLYGNGEVVLTKEDTVITGDHIESDANMEKVKVQGNARVQKGGAGR